MDAISINAGEGQIVTLNGEELHFYPLKFKHWGEILTWMRGCIMSSAMSSMRGTDFTMSERKEVLKVAQSEAKALSLSDCFATAARQRARGVNDKSIPDVSELDNERTSYLEDPSGMLRVVRLSLRTKAEKGEPRFSLDELEEMFKGDVFAVNNAYLVAVNVSLGGGETTEKKTGNTPTTRSKKRGKAT